eukprot:11215740-Alexandrium_andersonii.AAC.1
MLKALRGWWAPFFRQEGRKDGQTRIQDYCDCYRASLPEASERQGPLPPLHPEALRRMFKKAIGKSSG